MIKKVYLTHVEAMVVVVVVTADVDVIVDVVNVIVSNAVLMPLLYL